MGTNPRPFLESLISSLLSTPLSHESSLPVFHSTSFSFVRTDPFRHAMVVSFPVSVAPLQTLQLLPVFHRSGNLKQSLRPSKVHRDHSATSFSYDHDLLSLMTERLVLQIGFYTCQLFLRYKREIFILAVPEILNPTRSLPKIPEEVRRLPKFPEYKREVAPSAFPLKNSEIARKLLSFIHFTHGFRSVHGSE